MRRWLSGILAVIVVVIGGIAAFLFWPAGTVDAQPTGAMPSGQALIARGRYLTRAADCFACHTASGGQPYAGGVAFKLPFGTIYSPNITPDKATGIGNWTDADFVRAMHRGVGRDGQMLYPAFPYASYALMSTNDALAIKAYLFTLPAVHAVAPENHLGFPYNQRYLMRFWRLLYVPGHPFTPVQGKPADWNRGYYLANALGHCGECHTPRNFLYGLQNGQRFAGGTIEGWTAYNITSDKQDGIGGWTAQQIAQYLSQGYAPGHGAAGGNMAQAVSDSLQYLTPQDMHDLVAYLRSVPAQRSKAGVPVDPNPPAVKASTAYLPAADEVKADTLGLQIFQSACASCHAWNGQGLEIPQAALLGSETVNNPQAPNILQTILNGDHLATSKGDAFMPAFGSAYSNAEIAAVANYVAAHFGGKTPAITPADVASARKAG